MDPGARRLRSAGTSHRGKNRIERARCRARSSIPTIRYQLQANSTAADIWLVRMPLPSLDARVALSEMAASLGLPSPKFDGDPAYSLYAAENALLQAQRVIPLLHLRTAAGLSANVMGWHEDPDGSWRLPDVWLEAGKP